MTRFDETWSRFMALAGNRTPCELLDDAITLLVANNGQVPKSAPEASPRPKTPRGTRSKGWRIPKPRIEPWSPGPDFPLDPNQTAWLTRYLEKYPNGGPANEPDCQPMVTLKLTAEQTRKREARQLSIRTGGDDNVVELRPEPAKSLRSRRERKATVVAGGRSWR